LSKGARSFDDRTRVNERIRAPKVRLIAEDGEQLGIVGSREALEEARARGLDLVEVAAQAKPPVVRIMDYGKYLYQQKKRAQEAKKNQRQIQIKEIKFRPKIDEHDYNFKKNHIKRFLEEGNHVKVVVMYRGREIVHKDIGERILNRVVEELNDLAKIEKPVSIEGRNHSLILSPKEN
jgi:translation initiation factor IF-3